MIWRRKKQETAAEAVAEGRHVQIDGSYFSPEALPLRENAGSCFAPTLTQVQFDKLCRQVSPAAISFKNLYAEDISSIQDMNRLQNLTFEYASKICTLRALRNLENLTSLYVMALSKWEHFAEISAIPNLTKLSISGGISKRTSIDSLSSVGNLTSLKSLDLINVRVSDKSLSPLCVSPKTKNTSHRGPPRET